MNVTRNEFPNDSYEKSLKNQTNHTSEKKNGLKFEKNSKSGGLASFVIILFLVTEIRIKVKYKIIK